MKQEELRSLWAPWRIGYIVGPKPEQCVFCGKGSAAPACDAANLVLERAAHSYVLMNAFPYNPGHLLIAPYAHVAAIEDLPRAALHEMMDLAVKWKLRSDEVLRAQGINLGLNLGGAAGAGITEHLHLHLVPRWQGDTNFMSTVAGTRVISQALDELYQQLHMSPEQGTV